MRLHPLTFLEEGDEVTVGRADIDSYGLFPPDGAALVRRLEAGSLAGEAAQWYQEQYGEQVDIEEFLDVLEELDLWSTTAKRLPPSRRSAGSASAGRCSRRLAWFVLRRS